MLCANEVTLLGYRGASEREWLSREGKEDLSLLGIDALPPEEPSVKGPRAGSNHCQSGGNSCREEIGPCVVRDREYLPEFNQRNYCSGDRRPQSSEEKNSRANQQHGRRGQ